MDIVTYLITGTHPILMNNPASMRSGQTDEGKITAGKNIPSPDEEALGKRYLNDHGDFCFPAQGFKSSFVLGAKGRRVNKLGLPGVLAGTIFPAEDWVNLIDPKTQKPLKGDKYTLDVRRCVIKGMGVIRGRPLVGPWAALLALEVDTELIHPVLIEEVGNMAGRTVGVGDFRPAKKGSFGRYKVELLNREKYPTKAAATNGKKK